jgi:hypothetical protein
MATATTPLAGDLVLLAPGSTPGPGLYLVTAVLAGSRYGVASPESPKDNHAVSVPQSRIVAVFRGA